MVGDRNDAYDVYLATCLKGAPEDPDAFLSRHPDADTEMRELIRALHREYAGASPPGAGGPLPFDRLGGYRLKERLGAGGMGSVFLAEQESLGRTVALKVVRPELGGSDTMLRRFRREARAIAKLRHPGIVSVYELGEDQGVQFIAMELVPGQPLDEVLRENEALPAHRIFQWMAQVGRALSYAHERGVIHRDVKPGNILITPDDRAVLLDFGIAHLTGQDATRLTQSFAGSPLYAAPEQIASGEVDARTDVYLLGVTTYECMTGKLPFQGGTMEGVFRRVLLEDAIPPTRLNSSLPRDADLVVGKAMEKQPPARYEDMAAFAADLEALSRSQPVVARAPGALARLRKWARRKPVHATVLAALLVAAIGIAVFLVNDAASRERERMQSARRFVQKARSVLARYRTARLASKAFDEEYREAARIYDGRHTTHAEDRRHEELVDQGEDARVSRDLMFSRVLELLQQARERHPDVSGIAEVTTRLWIERAEDARSRGDATAVRKYRAEIARQDPEGRHSGTFLKSAWTTITSSPAGCAVYGFRYVVQRDIVPGGDRRLVPVPLGDAETPVPPGTWTLRVVRGAGTLRPGDQILTVFGHPIEATHLAWEDHGPVRRGDRLSAIGKRAIRLMIDAAPPTGTGPHRFTFVRDGRKIEVRWHEAPIEILTAAQAAERGGIAARVFQDGVVRDIDLPHGLTVRTTAVPFFCSPANLLGHAPLDDFPVEPGRHAFIFRKPGYEDLTRHADFREASYASVPARLNPTGSTPPGFVFIWPWQREDEPFWIQEREVTSAEYLLFLNDAPTLAAIDRARGKGRYIRYPRNDQKNSATGGHWPREADGRFRLPPGWQPEHPARGISRDDARAYANWRSLRDGRTYALPTDRQWARAGLNSYPFGHVFRPKWVSSLHVRRSFRGYDAVMSFPIDESPYGVYDMSGSVTEWVEWTRGRGFDGIAVGGSALRAKAWEFSIFGWHPRDPSYAGGDVGFRLVFAPAEAK